MYGMPFFGIRCKPVYGHLLDYGVGLRPGYRGLIPPYGGYGHLQEYGVGLHPDYAPCAPCATGYGYTRKASYAIDYLVQDEKPVNGKG